MRYEEINSGTKKFQVSNVIQITINKKRINYMIGFPNQRRIKKLSLKDEANVIQVLVIQHIFSSFSSSTSFTLYKRNLCFFIIYVTC